MKHLSYEFPSEAGQRWDVRPIPFRSLFNDFQCISIPLFQRKYCWTPDQIEKWFDDLTCANPRFTSGLGHSVGKIMFKRNLQNQSIGNQEAAELMCIDGQQRITTTLLSLASLRDCIYQFIGSVELGDLADQLNCLVIEINSILFSDVDAFTKWEGDAVAHIETANASTLESLLCEGKALLFSRLQPSYLDRLPFFELILVGQINFSLSSRPFSLTPTNVSVRRESMPSVQYRVKSHFDALISADLDGRSVADRVARCRHLFSQILDYFQMVFMEFLNDGIDLPQLFLWLQEKSIFSMGALLYNAAPGIKFKACDLVRNLLMSEVINTETVVRAEVIYRELLILPIEQYFSRRIYAADCGAGEMSGSSELFDEFLESFADHVAAYLARSNLRPPLPPPLPPIADDEPSALLGLSARPIRAMQAAMSATANKSGHSRLDNVNPTIIAALPPHFELYFSSEPSSFQQTLNMFIERAGAIFDPTKNKSVFLYARIHALYENLRRHFSEVASTTATSEAAVGLTSTQRCFAAGYGDGFEYEPTKSPGYLAAKLMLLDLARFRMMLDAEASIVKQPAPPPPEVASKDTYENF